ncbi:MAG: GNAT family N-acetyltransferase [Solirubrobacterales bacterium]
MSSDVRRAGAADGDEVTGVVERAFAHYVPRIGGRPAPMDEDYDQLCARGEVYVSGDPIRGVLVLRDGGDHLFVDVVAVDPPAQGSGIGGELMGFAELEAVRLGRPELRLLTNERMTENLAFYAHLCYEEYERRTEHGYRRVYLRKAVPVTR